jgi:hypothetical protein
VTSQADCTPTFIRGSAPDGHQEGPSGVFTRRTRPTGHQPGCVGCRAVRWPHRSRDGEADRRTAHEVRDVYLRGVVLDCPTDAQMVRGNEHAPSRSRLTIVVTSGRIRASLEWPWSVVTVCRITPERT